MTKKLGCDHLDAPYRRLLKENEELRTLLKSITDKVIPGSVDSIEVVQRWARENKKLKINYSICSKHGKGDWRMNCNMCNSKEVR